MIDASDFTLSSRLPSGIGFTLTFVLAAFALAGCAPNEPGAPQDTSAAGGTPAATSSAPEECVVGRGGIALGATSADWAGSYSVSLLSTDGTRVEGSLTLVDQAEEFRAVVGPGGEVAPNTRIPLFGWTDMDVSPLGAIVPGDASSQDPEAPGVAVLESRIDGQVPNILLRLGSGANRRGEVRFDGAFTVLRVTEIRENGFSGRWNSGAGTNRATGQFCAYAR